MLNHYLNQYDDTALSKRIKEMIGNGNIKFRIGRARGTVYGGPYRERPISMFGVKLAPEIKKACDASCSIPDFGVPEVGTLNVALMDTVMALYQKRDVYVGCMGGWGRTGLFLACLRKVEFAALPWWRRLVLRLSGYKSNPVQFVRDYYSKRAVETAEQESFVRTFDPSIVVEWGKRVRYI